MLLHPDWPRSKDGPSGRPDASKTRAKPPTSVPPPAGSKGEVKETSNAPPGSALTLATPCPRSWPGASGSFT